MRFRFNAELEEYAYNHTKPETNYLYEILLNTSVVPSNKMLSGRITARLLQILTILKKPHLVLEIGTYTGYSTIAIAEVLPPHSKILTCEINKEFQEIAQRNFLNSPYKDQIEIIKGDALEFIRRIPCDTIDLAFVDADKDRYPLYYEELLKITKKGGIIVFDNTLLSGKVLKPYDKSSTAVDKLNKLILNDLRVLNVFLTVHDGINIVIKK